MAFINWLKENWFKLGIALLFTIFVLSNLYSFVVIPERNLIVRCNRITNYCVLMPVSRIK